MKRSLGGRGTTGGGPRGAPGCGGGGEGSLLYRLASVLLGRGRGAPGWGGEGSLLCRLATESQSNDPQLTTIDFDG